MNICNKTNTYREEDTNMNSCDSRKVNIYNKSDYQPSNSYIEECNVDVYHHCKCDSFNDKIVVKYLPIEFIEGERGDKGPTGDKGPMGIRGIQGPVGEQGPQGPVGEQGPQGEQGPVGEQGPQGPVGEQGLQGLQGPQGFQGAQGQRGIQGSVSIINQNTGLTQYNSSLIPWLEDEHGAVSLQPDESNIKYFRRITQDNRFGIFRVNSTNNVIYIPFNIYSVRVPERSSPSFVQPNSWSIVNLGTPIGTGRTQYPIFNTATVTINGITYFGIQRTAVTTYPELNNYRIRFTGFINYAAVGLVTSVTVQIASYTPTGTLLQPGIFHHYSAESVSRNKIIDPGNTSYYFGEYDLPPTIFEPGRVFLIRVYTESPSSTSLSVSSIRANLNFSCYN